LNRYVRAAAALAAAAALLPALAGPAEARPAPAATRADPALAARLAQALAVPHVPAARTSALAVDLVTGEVLFGRNAALALAPASTEKLAVSYALLATFGPGYRIETRVLGNGWQDGAVWRGDLVLKGYGDPALAAAQLRSLAAQVRELGVRRVTGRVLGDESFYDARRVAPGWRASYYIRESEPLSALVVDRARYRGAVSGNPALAAAALFRQALQAQGVAVAKPTALGRAEDEVNELARVASAPLLRLVTLVNRDSDNFAAEMLLKHLGAVQRGEGTTPAGAAEARALLAEAGVPLAGVRLVDGSGLSLQNRTTAACLVAILRLAWADPVLRPSFLASLAVAGRSGTLRKRLRGPPALGQVVAKTGTTRASSALAGYVRGRYVFAVVTNGAPVSSYWARQAQDRFVTALAK
jgi:D-alanyl-D-alanine carboxypeptidase/D-alanyl-D-alanine-endopeptidase (penicillin-binding protein 4)